MPSFPPVPPMIVCRTVADVSQTITAHLAMIGVPGTVTAPVERPEPALLAPVIVGVAATPIDSSRKTASVEMPSYASSTELYRIFELLPCWMFRVRPIWCLHKYSFSTHVRSLPLKPNHFIRYSVPSTESQCSSILVLLGIFYSVLSRSSSVSEPFPEFDISVLIGSSMTISIRSVLNVSNILSRLIVTIRLS